MNPVTTEMQSQPRETRTLTAETAPSAAVWRLSQAIRSWPSPDAREWTRRMVQKACENPAVLAVVAIGSAVREVNAAQDVDFLLVHTPGEPPMLGPLPLDVDVRAYDAATVDDRIASGHDLLGWAVQFGVLLCERQQYWTCLSEQWTDRVPLPSPDKATERAIRARNLTEDLRIAGDWEAAAEQYVIWLTQDARARLIRAGVYPASRPELAGQLRQIGAYAEADVLDSALADRLRRCAG